MEDLCGPLFRCAHVVDGFQQGIGNGVVADGIAEDPCLHAHLPEGLPFAVGVVAQGFAAAGNFRGDDGSGFLADRHGAGARQGVGLLGPGFGDELEHHQGFATLPGAGVPAQGPDLKTGGGLAVLRWPAGECRKAEVVPHRQFQPLQMAAPAGDPVEFALDQAEPELVLIV